MKSTALRWTTRRRWTVANDVGFKRFMKQDEEDEQEEEEQEEGVYETV